ncbi:extracellular solute-binding protein family 1 [Colletotrichum musicola]|uniref:Extracellular solute-binding protein family 1 n=1 Tax=Colletotrichum musicola TaxID=2175873 RepID=A0A8H6NFM8_9PEZI|nr:extracellular solute-binding protein family 1 [Colletotrichum musicola]
MVLPTLVLSAALTASVAAYDTLLDFNGAPEVETRSIDEIHKAALAEGGVVTLWHGGDEKNQQDALKAAFEKRFPGMTLNLTVDVSKFIDGNIDRQLSQGNVYIDSVILQTLQDFPRWDEQGALLRYKPLLFDKIHPGFRDVFSAWYAVVVFGWTNIWNADKISEGPVEYPDFLKPEFKDKLVFTYPNDDDAVLYAFDLAMQQYGYGWFENLLAQNPRWVRGTATPTTVMGQANNSYAATFTGSVGMLPAAPYNISIPKNGFFVTWGQRGAILKDAPHKEGAKLLHNFLLSDEYQDPNVTGSWSVRTDIPPPTGWPALMDINSTNPVDFERFMANRERVERLKIFFEDKIGTAQGLSPLIDDL